MIPEPPERGARQASALVGLCPAPLALRAGPAGLSMAFIVQPEQQARALPQLSHVAERLWLLAALSLALLFAGRNMAPALSPDVVQDDVRQHVFWMARFRDPELFRDDLIADYHQAVAPPGFGALYWAISRLVEPLLASKLLPPLLGLIAALFTFRLVRRLHPSPVGAFLATVLLSWYVWQYDDLPSATPRAFILPLLAALLWALADGRLALATGLVALTATIYPGGGVLGLALLGVRLVRFHGWRPYLTRERSAWAACLVGAFLVALGLLPGQFSGAPYGQVVSAAQARAMPEFHEDGRLPFFSSDRYRYWFRSSLSGLSLNATDVLLGPNVPVLYEIAALAALLPLLLLLRRRLPAVTPLRDAAGVLPQLLVASFTLFFLAHLLLFRLYLPGRFVRWSLPIVLCIAAGLALAILLELLAARLPPRRRSPLAGGALALALGLALYPAHYNGFFVRDRHPTITAYLRSQPKDILVAGVPSEADFVPTLASRRGLTGREYMFPLYLGYYGEQRQRTEALIEAYYAQSPRAVADFAARYGVDLFLVDRAAFDARKIQDVWGEKFKPFTPAAALALRGSGHFALEEAASGCAVVDDGEVAVVPVSCLR